jgi:hypothetical protein
MPADAGPAEPSRRRSWAAFEGGAGGVPPSGGLLLRESSAPYGVGREEDRAEALSEDDGWTLPERHRGGWTEVRADFPRLLSTFDALRAAGCIGYALRQHLNGNRLSLPAVVMPLCGEIDRTGETDEERFADLSCSLLFVYDSDACCRRGPAATLEAFAAAAEYVIEGSPVRQGDGLRLCGGIGKRGEGVAFWVR